MVGVQPSTFCDFFFFLIFFSSSFPIAFPYSNCFKSATWKAFSALLSSRELGHMRELGFSVTVPADVAASPPARGTSAGLLIHQVSLGWCGAIKCKNKVCVGGFKQTPRESRYFQPRLPIQSL